MYVQWFREGRAKLRDCTVWPVRARCYSQAALSFPHALETPVFPRISIPYVFDVWDCSVQKIIGRTTWMMNNLAKTHKPHGPKNQQWQHSWANGEAEQEKGLLISKRLTRCLFCLPQEGSPELESFLI